jgi:predicted phosphodiesterase
MEQLAICHGLGYFRRMIKNLCAMLLAGLFAFCWLPATAFASNISWEGLLLPPYLGRPTPTGVVLNLIPKGQDLSFLTEFRSVETPAQVEWQNSQEVLIKAGVPGELPIGELAPDTGYEYRLWGRTGGKRRLVGTARFHTQRTRRGPFGFAVFTDAHITRGHDERVKILREIGRTLTARQPEFVMMLGDNIQTFTSHGGPMVRPEFGPFLYRRYRQALGGLAAAVPCFWVNGNWEGENGWHRADQKDWARKARLDHVPTPLSTTYPEGGSTLGDYYAFTWGEVLCVVLNVTGYTLTDHKLGSKVGRRDDWTLGDVQKRWLEMTLKASHAPWKLIFIHHSVGGGSPDEHNARYGRGGGLGAGVGEQAQVHDWMKKYGVQAFFYGHDHVFTDTVVDGIHYICAGSAGAPWKFDRSDTGYTTYWTPYGFTWVGVEKKWLRIGFHETDGREVHRFSISCRH